MGCSLPGSSVYGILQERILEWVAILFSREDLQGIFPTQGSNPGLLHCGQFFIIWANREAQSSHKPNQILDNTLLGSVHEWTENQTGTQERLAFSLLYLKNVTLKEHQNSHKVFGNRRVFWI